MAGSDKYYVERCLNGHPDDYRYLVRQYQSALTAQLTGILGQRHLAEEAAQEAFVRAYFALEKLKKRKSFFAWLMGIATNVAKEQLRDVSRQKSEPLSESIAQSEDGHKHSPDIELRRAIARLPTAYREVILLRYYGGLSCGEIGEQLDAPVGTVTKTLSRAYAMLREFLQKEKTQKAR